MLQLPSRNFDGFFTAMLNLVNGVNGDRAFKTLVQSAATEHLSDLFEDVIPTYCKHKTKFFNLIADNIHLIQDQLDSATVALIANKCCSAIEANESVEEAVAALMELWANFEPAFCERRPGGKKCLATKVLQVIKNVAKNNDNDVCLRVQVVTSLFSLLEKCCDLDIQTLIYKILVLFMLEWHEDQFLRSHLTLNFGRSLETRSDLLTYLVTPLCRLIMMQITDIEMSLRYLNSEDFEFIAKLAWKANHVENTEQIVAITRVLECYMVRRPCQFRNMADRIFVQLVQGKCCELFQVQLYLKQHLAMAVAELLEAERELDLHNANSGTADETEVQMQIRYLCSHILGLAKGSKIFAGNFLQEYVIQTLKSAQARYNGVHI